MICFAQGSSWARVAGWQLKIRRRLGVSPGPVALYGPVTVNVSKCGWPDVSRVSVELRMNGCSRVGLVASLRATNAAPMTCGPAVSFRRIRPRSSMASPAFVMFTRLALKSASPPMRKVCTRAPSTVYSTSCSYSRPRVTPRLVRNIFTAS